MTSLYVLMSEKLRKVLPDDIFWSVAFDDFGTSVPCDNVAAMVEKKDCIVAYAIDDGTYLSVLVPYRFLCGYLFGGITDKAEHNRTRVRLDGLEHDFHGTLAPIFP